MNDKTSKSHLSLRTPSNETDEKFISGISSVYEAAELRRASNDPSITDYHSPVKFSWKEFWKTMIYENLPPVIFSPIATLFLEKSRSRAWHVSQNRMLIAVSTMPCYCCQSIGLKAKMYIRVTQICTLPFMF